MSKVFDFGYKLNPYVESDTIINEKKLNRYLSLLRKLDKKKSNIRRQYFNSYNQLFFKIPVKIHILAIYNFLKVNHKRHMWALRSLK